MSSESQRIVHHQRNPDQLSEWWVVSTTRQDGLLLWIKLILTSVNRIGLILSILNFVFGLIYPEAMFPGGLRGHQMVKVAIISIILILFGMCATRSNQIIYLVSYIIVFLVTILAIIADLYISRKDSIVGQMSTPYIIGCVELAVVILILKILLIYKLRRTDRSIYHRSSESIALEMVEIEQYDPHPPQPMPNQSYPKSTPDLNSLSTPYHSMSPSTPTQCCSRAALNYISPELSFSRNSSQLIPNQINSESTSDQSSPWTSLYVNRAHSLPNHFSLESNFSILHQNSLQSSQNSPPLIPNHVSNDSTPSHNSPDSLLYQHTAPSTPPNRTDLNKRRRTC